MSFKRKLFPVLAVLCIALALPLSLPQLSAHAPTLTAATPAPSHAPALPDSLLFLGPFAGIVIRKDSATIAKKFASRASSASGDYKDGVAGAGQSWKDGALLGEKNYEIGVQESIADRRFGKGIEKAGIEKYQRNATTLGPQRFSQGVANAESAYQRGVEPHLAAMRSLQLPARDPKGSQQNQQRQNITATRNREVKLGKA